MATKQQPTPAFLSRIAQEFSPQEFSPVDFDEYIGNVDQSQYDVTLPWEDGSDHADEDEERSHGPQHEQEERVTPHGTMTSILSAAGYDTISDDQQLEDENNENEQQDRLDKQILHQARQQQNQHKKSLRLRAAKYFRGGQKSEPVDTAYCDSDNRHDNLQDETPDNGAVNTLSDQLDDAPSQINPTNSYPDDLQHEPPVNGAVNTTNDQLDYVKQTNSTRALSTKISHIGRTTPSPTQNHATKYRPTRLPDPAKRQSPQNNKPKPSLTFFPRTRVASPSNQSPSSQSGESSPALSDSSKHTDAKTEVTTAMNSISNTVVTRYSDPPLSMSGASRYSDPSLQYPDDVQSQTTSLATSVSYASDLENAARRILGRKRIGVYSSREERQVIGGHSSGEERQVIGDTAILGSRSGIIGEKVQRRPSKERMMKVTRRSFGLPTRDESDNETEKESIEASEGEKMDVLHPLPPSRGYISDYTEERDDNQFEEEDKNQYTQKIASMLGTSAQNHPGNQLNNSEEEEEEEEAIERLDQIGAFPTFGGPDLPEKVDGEPSALDNTIDDFEDEWGLVPTTSWVDPNRAFLAADQEDYENYYDHEEDDAQADFEDPNNHEGGFNGPIYDMADAWDDNWYDQRQSQRASCSSSLEGDAGAESENDGADFDKDDYFHDFGSKPGQSWGVNTGECWEKLPAPVQFSPSHGTARSNASNDDNAHIHRMILERDDEYITRTSIDFFAWNEDENLDDRNNDNRSARSLPNRQYQFSTDDLNLSMDVLSDTDAERRTFLLRGKTRRDPKTNPIMTAAQEYPFSDGDTPTRKPKRGFHLFRPRNPPHSEGERSDSDWESTPVRSKRWSNMQKLSPRSLFGDRRHDKQKKNQMEKDRAVMTQYEMLNMSTETAQYALHQVSPAPKQLKSTIDSIDGDHVQPKIRQVTPYPGHMIANINCSPAQRKESTSRVHNNATKGRVDLQTVTVSPPLHTNTSSNRITSPVKVPIHSSVRSNTPVSGLNDSMMTHETPLVSNKAHLDELPPAPSFTYSNSSLSGVSGNLNNKSSSLSGLPPREKRGSPVTARKKQPPSPGFTGSDIVVDNENEDDCSTLQSESLGSLVTKAPPAETPLRSDSSMRSGMSEIERLRRENERLREELENRSTMSSKVSSTYVKTLQEQNELLRQTIYNETRSSSDMMYKSTIATLLERDDPVQRRRRRKNSSNSPRETKAANYPRHNARKPTSPLIHGADFDDESLTTYTDSIRCKKVQFTRDANWQKAGDQVNTATQKMNSSGQKKTCEIPIKPLELIAACTRRDTGNNTGTAMCATATSGTKDVIGRVLGCVKQSKCGDKSRNPAGQGGDSSTASDSLVHKRADTKSPRVSGESLLAPGFVDQ